MTSAHAARWHDGLPDDFLEVDREVPFPDVRLADDLEVVAFSAGDELVIYDDDNHQAWLQSPAEIDLEEAI